MSFLEEIRKQPMYVREVMFGLCVIITISLIGIVWFQSFEEDIFVTLNPEPDKQEQFYASRAGRTPIVYANITKALGNMRAALYDAMGFMGEYTSNVVQVGEEYKGEAYELPLSGDKH